MLHYAYKVIFDEYKYHNFDLKTLEKHLKGKYHTNDYFPLSAISQAKGILKSQKELLSYYQKKDKKKLKSINNKIKKEQSLLNNDLKYLQSLIDNTKGLTNKPKYKEKKLTKIEGNNCFYDNQETTLYLYEVQILKPRIKQRKARIGHLIFKRNSYLNKKYNLKGICFGGRKLMKSRDTVYLDNHDEWLS